MIPGIHGWLHMIIFKNLPVNIVEDADYRSQLKHYSMVDHKTHVSTKTIVAVIFEIVVLVEHMIGTALRAAKCGAIMHDGWLRGRMHYIALFATYMDATTEQHYSKATQKYIPRSVLLSVAPMAYD
jgi:hypothetical protein